MKMEKISEGAESSIYSLDFLGLDSVLKRRTSKAYRIGELDRSLREKRTRKEARIMGIVSSLGIDSPVVLLVDRYDIVMSRIKGRNLNVILGKKGKMDLNRVFDNIGKSIAILHNNNITHGDYTPANIIIDHRQNAYLIDFGLSDMSLSIEDKALDILLMKRAINGKYFNAFIKSYRTDCKDSSQILKRLEEIEKRGRYNTRTLLAN